MKIREQKEILRKIVSIRKYVTARDIFLASIILYPESNFISPAQLGQILEQMKDIKSIKSHTTSPKMYFI